MNGDILKERIDQHLQARNVREKKKREYLYASDVFGCKRKIVLEARGVEGQPMDPKLLRVFDNGHAVHDRVTKYLEEMGVLKSKEQDIPNDDDGLNVHGRYDGIAEMDGEDAVLEIKSINMREVKTPMEHHRGQIQWYMHKLKIPRGVIIYESKQTNEIFTFDEEHDQELLDKVTAWFEDANHHLRNDKLPIIETGYKPTAYPCSGCKFNSVCYAPKCDECGKKHGACARCCDE